MARHPVAIDYGLVDTAADLATTPGNKYRIYVSLGQATIGDGDGGQYYWDETSTAFADQANVVQVTGMYYGRHIKFLSGFGAAAARRLGASAVGNPPIDFVPLIWARGTCDFNAGAAPLEYGGYQWVLYWNSTSSPILARRLYPDSLNRGTPNYTNNIWTSIDLSLIGATQAKTFADTAVDTTADTITIPAHGWVTGDSVRYAVVTGSITGLTNGSQNWVIVIDANTISLAISAPNALAGTPIVNFTATAAGSFTLSPNVYNIGSQSDNHQDLKLAFDSAGRIHVWANQHSGRASYAYCDVSDAGFATAANWHVPPYLVSDADENETTYWEPIAGKNGVLLARYRQGFHGDGIVYLNRWDAIAKTWSRVCQLFSSGYTGDVHAAYNAYPCFYTEDSGRIHCIWGWTEHDVIAGTSNHDICYTYSDDNGVTWRKSNGSLQTVPIAQGNEEKAAVIGTGINLIGGNNLCIDPSTGIIYYPLMHSGSGLTQYYLLKSKVGGGWESPVLLSNWNYLYDTIGSPVRNARIAGPSIFRTNAGRVCILYRNSAQFRGTVRLMDVTDPANILDAPISRLDVYQQGGQAFDAHLIANKGRFHFIQVPCLIVGTGSAQDINPGGALTTNMWGAMPGVVTTIDVTQLDKIFSRACSMPGIEVVSSGSTALVAPQNITNTVSPGDLLGYFTLANIDQNRDQVLFFRFEVEAQMTAAGTFTVFYNTIRQVSPFAGHDVQSSTVTTQFATLEGPWMPMYWPDPVGDFAVALYGRVTANSADVRQARVWMGRLAHVR